MPIRFEVHAHDRIVQTTLIGALAVSDYADAAQKIIAEPGVMPGFGLLVDGRALDPLPGAEELRELVEVARQMRVYGIESFALVGESDLQYIVGQLFATLVCAAINLDARVFRTIDVARDWLRVAVAQRNSRSETAKLGDTGDSPTVPPS